MYVHVCLLWAMLSVHDPKAAHELVVLVFILIYHLGAKIIFLFESAFYPVRAVHRTQRTIVLPRDGRGAAVCVCCVSTGHAFHFSSDVEEQQWAVRAQPEGSALPILPPLPSKAGR